MGLMLEVCHNSTLFVVFQPVNSSPLVEGKVAGNLFGPIDRNEVREDASL